AQVDCANAHVGGSCDPTRGCVACAPGLPVCVGNQLKRCSLDGTIGEVIETCQQQCVSGGCTDACSQAAAARSYIGCEYWPVDLENLLHVWGPSFGGDCGSIIPGATMLTTGEHLCLDADVVAGICDYGDDCSAWGPGYICGSAQACVSDGQHSP